MEFGSKKLFRCITISLFVPFLLGLGSGFAEWHIEDVDAPKSFHHSSIKLNGPSVPCIAYGGDHLYFAVWNVSGWTYQTVDSARGVGSYPSLALDGSGRPAIAYFDAIRCTLKFARYRGPVEGWSAETVDSSAYVGWHTSLALDGNGNPLISYYDVTHGDLKLARWIGAAWLIETVDDAGDVGQFTSLSLGPNGFPGISYYDVTNADLKFAQWSGSSWTILTVDAAGDVGRYSSLGNQDSGSPLIAYYDATNGDLKAARWTGSDWQIELVDGSGDVGQYCSLSVDRNRADAGVSYYDATRAALKYAASIGGIWTATTADATTGVGKHTSLALDETAMEPFISYFDEMSGALKLIYSSPLPQWSFDFVDYTGEVGRYTSLAIGQSGEPFISYYDVKHGNLKMASWTGGVWVLEPVDTPGDVGLFSSISLDGDGDPAIGYYDATNKDLKFSRFDGGAWNFDTVDTANDVGQYCSLAYGPSGGPGISYYDASARNLKLALYDGLWSVDCMDHSTAVGQHTSLAFDLFGEWYISYYGALQGDLKLAAQAHGTSCIDTLGNVGWYNSIAFDPSGNPAVSYYDITNRDLRYAYFDGIAWNIQIVDSAGDVGAFSSLAFNPEGDPAIGYFDWVNFDLKYAFWDGAAWRIETVDSEGDVGLYCSLAFDSVGNPAISYHDRTDGYLKFASTPYLRYESVHLESDNCIFGAPPGADRKVNPGEEVALRVGIRNTAGFIDYTTVTAAVTPVTVGVTPVSTVLNFGNVPRGQHIWNIGAPLTIGVPLWLDCGDKVILKIVLTTNEGGTLPPQYITLPVDGDPANCKCQGPPSDLQYDSFLLEADRCTFASPPGSDGRVNPGEAIDLRVGIRNLSPVTIYHSVTGIVSPLNPGVTPAAAPVVFGDISPGQAIPQTGRPLTMNVPLSLACGDLLVFSLTLTSTETGELEPQYFTVRVDGDPGNCACEAPGPDLRTETFRMTADRCPYGSPPGGDSRLNPGEEADFVLTVKNHSYRTDHHQVRAQIEAITPGILPTSALSDFGTVLAGQEVQNLGNPLTLSIPLSVPCGEILEFRVTYTSAENGAFPPEILRVPADGDPMDCYCAPVDLFYDSFLLEDDRCAFASPPGKDGLVNPGESVDLRIRVRNGSIGALTAVTGIIEPVTAGVTPPAASLDFGTIPAQQSAENVGAPLTVGVPLDVNCGDRLAFRITLTSAETGTLAPQSFEVPVDGDPGLCKCEAGPFLPKLYRGTVAAFAPGWQLDSLPLTSANDDETPPFPVSVTIPGTVTDDLAANVLLTLYRILLPGDNPSTGTRLTGVKKPTGVEFDF